MLRTVPLYSSQVDHQKKYGRRDGQGPCAEVSTSGPIWGVLRDSFPRDADVQCVVRRYPGGMDVGVV